MCNFKSTKTLRNIYRSFFKISIELFMIMMKFSQYPLIRFIRRLIPPFIVPISNQKNHLRWVSMIRKTEFRRLIKSTSKLKWIKTQQNISFRIQLSVNSQRVARRLHLPLWLELAVQRSNLRIKGPLIFLQIKLPTISWREIMNNSKIKETRQPPKKFKLSKPKKLVLQDPRLIRNRSNLLPNVVLMVKSTKDFTKRLWSIKEWQKWNN